MKKTSVKIAVAILITLILAGIYFYVTLPALNAFDQGFWMFIFLSVACFALVFTLLNAKSNVAKWTQGTSKTKKKLFSFEGGKVV